MSYPGFHKDMAEIRKMLVDLKVTYDDMHTMLRIFNICIETRIFPQKDSEIHLKLKELILKKEEEKEKGEKDERK